MQKRLMSIILAVMLLAAMATTAGAATYEEINQDAVFVKQSQRGTCTLASTAMMLRRAAMLNGDENWASITEASCRSVFWLAGRACLSLHLRDMTVDHARLPGGQANPPGPHRPAGGAPGGHHAPRRLRAPRHPADGV